MQRAADAKPLPGPPASRPLDAGGRKPRPTPLEEGMAPAGPSIALVIVLPDGEGAVESLMPRLRDLRPSPREIIAVGGQQADSPGRKPAGKRLRIVAGEPGRGDGAHRGGLS